MTLELIAFIASILFGILLYWRESSSNAIYRFFNKLINSKKLQMKANDKTGFVYQQRFLLRFVFVTFLFLVLMLISKFLIPINYATISMFASAIVGTLLGTYVANMVFKSTEIIDEKSDSIEEIVHTTIDKGKDFMDEVLHKEDTVKEIKEKTKPKAPKVEEKSARERLKDKGLL